MKISPKKLSSLMAPTLSKLVMRSKQAVVTDNQFAVKTSSKNFGNRSHGKDQFLLEKSLKDIDMSLLHELARPITGENISYRGFISSQLQHGPVDAATKAALKRAVAIKKMVTLLSTAVDDMRAIELRRISYSKG